AGLVFAPARRLPAKTGGWRALAAKILPVLLLLGALALIAAAARPQTRLARVNRTSDAIAIMMVADVSGSMEALDLSPKGTLGTPAEKTRLDVVKDTFEAFVKERPGDLIGLVTFGGYASTRAPPTLDHAALLKILEGVSVPSGVNVDREELQTAIGDALTTACARLKDTEPASRVIVLLSDGDSNWGIFTPEQAALAAKELGIRAYTIGVGSHDGTAPMRATDVHGRSIIQRARIGFDEAELRAIAQTTGGEYFSASSKDGLGKALESINRLETTPVRQTLYSRHDEHFLPLLLAGALLVACAATLNILAARRLA
ncbi:MAG: VWA domain-containing protein, partial [Kiritimatiellaeota bacterium]|nr:VWA domain-containing protein [Kiritimatiellota bacterium]